LSADPFEPNAMSRKPRRQDEHIFKGLNPFLIYYPIAQVIVSLSMFIWIWFAEGNLLKAQTAVFLTIGMFELYQSLASRSTIYPAVKVGIFRNKWLILAFLSSFAFMAIAIFVPSVGQHLKMHPLELWRFMLIVAVSVSGAVIIELCKYFKTRDEVVEMN